MKLNLGRVLDERFGDVIDDHLLVEVALAHRGRIVDAVRESIAYGRIPWRSSTERRARRVGRT